MPTIPLSELHAVMTRYDDFWGGKEDPPAEVVRKYAAELRAEREIQPIDRAARQAYGEDRAEADDLDVLADRYEREAT